MSEAEPTPPEVTVKLNTFSLPLAFPLMDGKYKPDGLGLSGFLGYVSKVGPEKATRVFDPMSITAAGGFVIRWLHGSDASLPYRHWSDRMALTAAWVIEHGGVFLRPTMVQSAIVFREGRTAWSDWRIDPEGDHLAIQVIRGPRKIDSYRWRICDGMQIADSGSEFRNQDLRLPDLSSHVSPGVPSEVALLRALDAVGFVKVAVGESGRPVVATPPEGGSHAQSESDRRGP